VDLAELRTEEKKLKTLARKVGAKDSEKFRGIGGSDTGLLDSEENLRKTDRKLIRAMHQSLDDLEGDIEQRKGNNEELAKFLDDQKMLLASSTPSIWPTRGWLSSRFGYRTSPFSKRKSFTGALMSPQEGAPRFCLRQMDW